MVDFTKRKKNYLAIKLANGKNLFLSIPKKRTFEKLTSFEGQLHNADDAMAVYDETAELTAEILSSNKTCEKYTAEQVNELMDIDDMMYLIRAYFEFAGGALKDPN